MIVTTWKWKTYQQCQSYALALSPRQEAKARDFAEIENIEKGGPIVMADFTIVNTGTIEELKEKLKKFF